MTRRLRAVAWLGVACWSACASSTEVSGIWRSQILTQGGLIEAGAGGLGVELVLRSFGPEAAGLIRFYDGPEFDRRRSAEPPDRQCACAFVHDGRVSLPGERLTFSLQGCLPGAAAETSMRVRGVFQVDSEGRLTGELRVDDPLSALDGAAMALAFERHGIASDIEPDFLTCERPSAQSGGNVYSGR